MPIRAKPRYKYRMYPEQEAALFGPERLSLVEASTKSGKTHAAMRWLAEQALALPGGTFWWVAPVYAQATMVRRRYARVLPKGLVARNNAGENSITLANGSKIWFKSAKNPDHLYGEDVHAAVIDEASRIADASITAVRTTLSATRGPWRMIGNVRGTSNMFYRMCRQAEKQALPGVTYHHINAYTAAQYSLPNLPDLKEIEDAKATLPPAAFQELYLADPTAVDTNPFGLAAIAACTVPDVLPGDSAAIGVDLAKAVDWTVVLGLDKVGDCVLLDRWQSPWDQTLDRVAAHLATGAPGAVDSTGVGSPIIDMLIARGQWAESYLFTQRSKQHLMQRTALALHEGSVRVPQVVAEELAVIEYKYTSMGVSYAAPAGYHDDCVMALGLGLHVLRGGWQWPTVDDASPGTHTGPLT